jgi:DNA-binding NarL/FixJ family response regulator
MIIYIYSKSDSFNEHMSKIIGVHVTYRSDLSVLKAGTSDIVLIHEASFSDVAIQEALRENASLSCSLAIADDLPDLGKMLRYTNLGIKGYCNAYMAKPHYDQFVLMLGEGHSWYPPELLSQALSIAHSSVSPDDSDEQLNELTSRQKQIALSIADGKSNKIVAEECGIAEQTVKSHLTQIFTKLKVPDRIGLIIHLKRLNLLGSNRRKP